MEPITKLPMPCKLHALPRAAGSLDPIVHVLVPVSTQEGQRGEGRGER